MASGTPKAHFSLSPGTSAAVNPAWEAVCNRQFSGPAPHPFHVPAADEGVNPEAAGHRFVSWPEATAAASVLPSPTSHRVPFGAAERRSLLPHDAGFQRFHDGAGGLLPQGRERWHASTSARVMASCAVLPVAGREGFTCNRQRGLPTGAGAIHLLIVD